MSLGNWPHSLTFHDMEPKCEGADNSLGEIQLRQTKKSKISYSTSKVDQIEVVFLGTVSALPTPTRAHSSLALRLDGQAWLFDAGESAQLQLSKSNIKSGKVDTIFITHLHGDHVFGLGPLVCTLAQTNVADQTVASSNKSNMEDAPIVLEIYGPLGTRAYLRNVLKYSYSFSSGRWRVHELLLPGETELDIGTRHPCEVVGRTIFSTPVNDVPTFKDILVDDEYRPKHPHLTVHASSIRHTVPTLGFVVEENPVYGSIPKHYTALVKSNPGVPMSVLQEVKAGKQMILPDGSFLSPPVKVPGRKICILGDTCDPSNMTALARNSDLVIHEATNAYIIADPETKETDSAESVERSTISHGHSTPSMAGKFAQSINAKSMIMNHFSSRYKGDNEELSIKIMDEFRAIAAKEFHGQIFTARDWESYSLSQKSGIAFNGVYTKYASFE